MSIDMATSLLALRAADPAGDVDVTALVPDWSSVLAAIDSDIETLAVHGRGLARASKRSKRSRLAGPARSGRPVRLVRPRARRLRLAVVTLVVAAVAVFVGVIAWPGSGHGPSSVAYGVTRLSDGTVTVRRAPKQLFTATGLQSQLRAAGVPADVLALSPPGACSEPLPVGVASVQPIVTHPSNLNPAEGFLIHPASIPPGAVLVLVLLTGTPGGAASTSPWFAGLYVTLNPPTCVAPSDASQPSSPGSATPPAPSK
jgi:hypothetical protein